jgi:ankyrin repeat protein
MPDVFDAIDDDAHATLEQLLLDPATINMTTTRYSSLGFYRVYGPLSWAARSASVKDDATRLRTMQMLIDAGCPAHKGACLLECATPALATLLIGSGAPPDQPDAKDPKSRTALAYRVTELSMETVNVLLQNGANPNAIDAAGRPLVFDVILGWIAGGTSILDVHKALAVLLMFALDLGQADASGDSILMELVRRQSLGLTSEARFYEFVDEILSRNLDLTAKNKAGENCLHLATSYSYARSSPFRLITRLMAFNAHYGINDMDLRGRTPLFNLMKPATFIPLAADDLNLVTLFLTRGASTTHQDNDGNTPVHVFADLSCLDKGAISNNPPPDPGQPGRKVYLDILDALLRSGADKSLKNNKGQTALAIAKATKGNNCYDFVGKIQSFQLLGDIDES